MATLMPQAGLNAPPDQRGDVISLLLNEYASFSPGKMSPYSYTTSPLSTTKDLPPPPPSKDLPVGMMRFQLRVDEPRSPSLYNGDRKDSIDSPRRTKILSRSISRSSKPPSLKLLASNGATAFIPPTPKLPSTSEPAPATFPRAARPAPAPPVPRQVQEERPLPDLPPPPPEKSERRKSQRSVVQATMGNHSSKAEQEVAVRRPSQDQGVAAAQSPVVKRKPAPQVMKKFKSLAELGNGPRGRGPRPPTRSDDSTVTITQPSTAQSSVTQPEELPKIPNPFLSLEEVSDSRNAISGDRPSLPTIDVQRQPDLPPTPPSEKPASPPATIPAPIPASTRRSPAIGLPSNPRSRSQDAAASPKHARGKSSTGFNIMKGVNNTSGSRQQPTTTLSTITPGPTPSPKKTPTGQDPERGATLSRQQIQAQLRGPESPVSPVSPEDSRRPFSFEAVPRAASRPPVQQQAQQPTQNTSYRPISSSPVSPQAQVTAFPPRTTSRPGAGPTSLPDSRPGSQTATRQTYADSRPGSRTAAQPSSRPDSRTSQPRSPRSPTQNPFANPPPQTISRLPPPPITNAHTACYANHARFLRSKNDKHPMACMICQQHRQEEFRACYWCHLRICMPCSITLEKTPGRDLKKLMDRRDSGKGGVGERGGPPGVMVWGAEGEYE
ncbi:hypothetical protein BDV96DRAFT_220147 [Lophiotrema nucula]|uniref:Uncharacterized protein n=1 Tax=Lophiotrema nucula TaxID=690887 RepID=A0A6A5YSC0_9PLEO|nr:hypothetical protein BDV96DRAFT_220147 [Lophiotrema nucula]